MILIGRKQTNKNSTTIISKSSFKYIAYICSLIKEETKTSSETSLFFCYIVLICRIDSKLNSQPSSLVVIAVVVVSLYFLECIGLEVYC